MYRYKEIYQVLKKEIEETPAGTKIETRHQMEVRFQCTRMTIDRAIAELIKNGYIYSIKGSGTFVKNSTSINPDAKTSWAVVMMNMTYNIDTGILQGVCDYAQGKNINVQVYNSNNEIEKQYEILHQLASSNIDGVILIPTISKNKHEDVFQMFLKKNIPLVFCNRPVESFPEVPLVCCNGYYGGYIATKLLYQKGYRKPAFLSLYFYQIIKERYYGYLAAVMEHGSVLNKNHIILGGDINTAFPGYDEVKVLLRLNEPPDSIFCASENWMGKSLLAGSYKAIQEMGLIVSDDIGIISHDNSMLCFEQKPITTAVSYPAYESGVRAAKIIYNHMNGNKLTGNNLFVFQPTLVERESCLGPVKL